MARNVILADSTGNILITIDNNVNSISKSGCTLEVNGTEMRLINSGVQFIFQYSDVSSPGSANIAALTTTIEGWLQEVPIATVIIASPGTPESASLAVITDNTAHDIFAAGGVGVFHYLTDLLITNSHATVGTLVTIQDDANTLIWQGYAAAAGGGFVCSLKTAVKAPASNKKLQVICGTSGASVYANASGYKL